MFSMAVAAMRRRRFAAAVVLMAVLLAPVAAATAVPAAQASVSHSAATSAYGGSQAGNAALNWAERAGFHRPCRVTRPGTRPWDATTVPI